VILFVVEVSLEALIDGRQPSAAVMPDGPGGPSLLAEDLLGATDRVGDVVGQEGIAAQAALVVGEASVGRLAPVLVVNLKDAVVIGSVGVGRSNDAGAEGTLVLGDAGPLGQLVPGNAQFGHLSGQGTPIHRSGLGSDCCQSQSTNHKKSFHLTEFTYNSMSGREIFIATKSIQVVAVESTW